MQIRPMIETDAHAITDAEIAQGWSSMGRFQKYQMRLKNQCEGRCISLIAECDSQPVGYVNVYLNGPLPEIVDFGVLEAYRRQGIGSALMDAAEAIAAKHADTVCLSIGLHAGYGSAQRMYTKRGYIPDGTGAYYNEEIAVPYRKYPLDDDLVLRLTKALPR